MDQPGPSSRNVVPQMIQEGPESPIKPENVENPDNFPRVGVEIPLGIGLESEDEYEEPSSEEENNAGPQNPEYGYDDDYIRDDRFTLYTRSDIYSVQGWKAFVKERRSCAGFLVPDPPILERLILVPRASYGVNWQQAVLSASGDVIVFQL